MPSDRYSPPVFQSADSGHAFKYPVLPIALNKADFPFPPLIGRPVFTAQAVHSGKLPQVPGHDNKSFAPRMAGNADWIKDSFLRGIIRAA
jgi:hypothetical protein